MIPSATARTSDASSSGTACAAAMFATRGALSLPCTRCCRRSGSRATFFSASHVIASPAARSNCRHSSGVRCARAAASSSRFRPRINSRV